MRSHSHSRMLRLEKHKEVLSTSRAFRETRAAVEPLQVARIRCLALGSPCTELQAPYQLAYLALLAEALRVPPGSVSVWDPVFDEKDKRLFADLGYVVEETYAVAPNTLYYMPHCPRAVAEQVFKSEEPELVLGNDLSVVIGTLSAALFLQQYPLLAHLNKLYEEGERESEKEKKESEKEKEKEKENGRKMDEFTVVRKKRGRRNVYVEPMLEYDFSLVYCSEVKVLRIHSDPGVWKNSFSDLALNLMRRRDEGPKTEDRQMEVTRHGKKKSDSDERQKEE